mgnify:FL=1
MPRVSPARVAMAPGTQQRLGQIVTTRLRKERSTLPGGPRQGKARAGSGETPQFRNGENRSPPDPGAPVPGKQCQTNVVGRSEGSAWMLVFACWVIASVSTLGALFFSEVMELPPCALCWYQRIFMFPLVLLLPVGLFPFDGKIVRYALPLLLVGWFISLFQLLLGSGFIPESIQPCTQGVSCKQVQIEWLGFLTIPLLSFVAFSVMNALLIAAHFRSSR